MNKNVLPLELWPRLSITLVQSRDLTPPASIFMKIKYKILYFTLGSIFGFIISYLW